MTEEQSIVLAKGDESKYTIKVKKDLIGVGKDYIIFELSEDALMQLGKLAMDITNSEIKQLSLKL